MTEHKKTVASQNTYIDTNRHLRVAAYCRVSSPSEEQATSLELQQQYWEAQIKQNSSWENVGIYAETVSGLNANNRAEFRKLISKCRKGKVDLILTKSISRFGRNTLECIRAIRELQTLGIDIFFELENIHSLDPGSRFIIELYCAFAQDESESKSKTIRWGVKQGFRSGTSGYANFECYGYRYDPAQRLVIEPAEAEIVEKIFNMRAAGRSLVMISNFLFENNIPSPTGKQRWSRETINKILHNEKYTGCVMLQKTYVDDLFVGKQKKNRGDKERYLVKHHHESIISDDLFQKCSEPPAYVNR